MQCRVGEVVLVFFCFVGKHQCFISDAKRKLGKECMSGQMWKNIGQ